MALTPKQQRFVAEYLVDLNATQAAIRAGYSPKTANAQAGRLLVNVSVQAAIAAGQKRLLGDAEATAGEVLRELKRVAFADFRKLYWDDGSLKHPKELDDETAAILAQVETLEEFDGRGEDRALVGFTKKVKLWDKLQALKLLGQRLGLWVQKHELSGPNGTPLPAPETHVHVTLSDRIDQFTAAFEGAAGREEAGGVPGDGAREPVAAGPRQGGDHPQAG